jgi:hypothetical protein
MTTMSKPSLPPHGNAKYPWALWVNGEVHKAKKGRHFTIEVEAFRKSLSSHASSHGLRVTTRVSGDVVTFQFFAKEGS